MLKVHYYGIQLFLELFQFLVRQKYILPPFRDLKKKVLLGDFTNCNLTLDKFTRVYVTWSSFKVFYLL